MSESFVDTITPWIDQDGLVGTEYKPPKWSGGNQLQETALACAIEVSLNGRNADREFIQRCSDAIGRCRNPDGSFNKNPGRTDEITHDDLLCVAAASRICGMPWARAIFEWGTNVGWDLSNTGKLYWDALAKPWQRAVYAMCAGKVPTWYESTSNVISNIISAGSGNPSSDRIKWITSVAVKGLGPMNDLSIDYWRHKAKQRYLSVGGMMLQYYEKDPMNPFCEFGSLLSF